MELTLDSNDIKQALTNYVSKMGVDTSNKRVDIALINGRMGNGNRAIVSITEETTSLGMNKYATVKVAKEAPVVTSSEGIDEEVMEEVVEDIPPVQIDFEEPKPTNPTNSLF